MIVKLFNYVSGDLLQEVETEAVPSRDQEIVFDPSGESPKDEPHWYFVMEVRWAWTPAISSGHLGLNSLTPHVYLRRQPKPQGKL